MRKFKTAWGDIVDLDSSKTYKYLPKNCRELDDMMFKLIVCKTFSSRLG